MVIKGTMEENESFRNFKFMDNFTEPTKREAEYNHKQGKFVSLSFEIELKLYNGLSQSANS